MSDSLQNLILLEKGYRRSKIERRVFSYCVHIPERRSGKDRRCGKDPGSKVKKRGMRYRHQDTKLFPRQHPEKVAPAGQ